MSSDLTLIDGTNETVLTILPGEDGKSQRVHKQTVPWEPGDPSLPWRVALHPWIEGLAPSRISPAVTMSGDLRNRPAMVYAKANADASNPNFLTFPPKVTMLTQPVEDTVFLNAANTLPYDQGAYGTVAYLGPASSTANINSAVRNFNGNAYFGGGQYLFKLDSTLTLTLAKNFGNGKTIYDLEVFNNELIIALGPSDKIWTMSTLEVFTEATDATYAIALGTHENKLDRVEEPNKISNCITAPLTLTSWVPADPEQYTAGDETWDVNDLMEYSGALAALKPNGAFFPNQSAEYLNQTPQLAVYPDVDNGKGSFSAFGSLYVPSIAGLLEVTVGSSPAVGPELANRPDFRMRVRAGVEWNRNVYTGAVDEAGAEESFICKMDRRYGSPFAYHEWVRLGTTDPVQIMVVYTGATNPTLVAAVGERLALITLGRGSGPDIDDENYDYGILMELEPGLFIGGQDMGVAIDWHGVKVVGKLVDYANLTCYYDMDDSGWIAMKSNQDGSGKVMIEDIGWFSTIRYCPPNLSGHAPKFKLTGSVSDFITGGTTRNEIYEIWAFGDIRPETTDILVVDVYASKQARIKGLFQGRRYTNWRLLREIYQTGRVVELKLPGYGEDERVRVRIAEMQESNMSTTIEGTNHIPTGAIRITFRRVDFSGVFNANGN